MGAEERVSQEGIRFAAAELPDGGGRRQGPLPDPFPFSSAKIHLRSERLRVSTIRWMFAGRALGAPLGSHLP